MITHRRYELTDREWSTTALLLPNKLRDMLRVDARRVLSSVLWRFRTGSSRAKFAERYDSMRACCNRCVRSRKPAVWDYPSAAVLGPYGEATAAMLSAGPGKAAKVLG